MAGRTDYYRPRPGFQGSENSGVEVTLHNQGGDRVISLRNGSFDFEPYRRGKDSHPIANTPNLTAVSTYKSIGQPSGTFTLTAKTARPDSRFIDLFDRIVDDDWVDITFTRHGRKWHTMRGLVDETRRATNVAGTGATSSVFTVTGRDFGKVWEATPVWFSPAARENVHGHVAARVFSTKRADQQQSNVAGDTLILDSPAAAIQGYLFGFLEELEGIGRANWNPPPSLPNIETDGTSPSFIKSLFLNMSGFSGLPDRRCLDPNFIMAGGNLWDLAKEWSDPIFTELFCDLLLPSSRVLNAEYVEALVEDTKMMVVFRDKPFPIVAEEWEGDKGKDSAWFNLPEYIISRESIQTLDIGRSGMERFNAFFVTNPLQQEATQGAIDMVRPLWDKDDILRHGLRRFDIQSKYGSKKIETLLGIAKEQRAVLRDWYAINPYLFNGTLSLGVGMPHVHIGGRARIPGATSENHDENYYIESVAHNWQFGVGMRTSLGVTRGWRGTDEALVEALEKLVATYEEEPLAEAEEATE